MEQKLKTIMKKILFFLLLVIMASCNDVKKEETPTYPFHVIVKDSCEYLYLSSGSGHRGYLAHKGNCKHCAEVRQREYDALVERIKEAVNRK